MDELNQGRIVKLDNIGSFQIGVRSNGMTLPEEVGAQSVKSAHLNFRPSKRMRKMLDVVDYKLVTG